MVQLRLMSRSGDRDAGRGAEKSGSTACAIVERRMGWCVPEFSSLPVELTPDRMGRSKSRIGQLAQRRNWSDGREQKFSTRIQLLVIDLSVAPRVALN